MFDILQKAGRSVKKFMSEKINTCKEILSSAQNRAILGAIVINLGWRTIYHDCHGFS